jgi:hypothetical protein
LIAIKIFIKITIFKMGRRRINNYVNKKFVKLFEATISRFNRGGFLASDRVSFVDNVLRNDYFKKQPEELANAVKELINCGLNLRVKNIKSTFPAVGGAGNPDNFGYSFAVEVAPEIAPGRLDTNKTVTVPAELLVRQDDGINLPPVPDSLVRKDSSYIKPKKTSDIKQEEIPFYRPHNQTHLSNVNGKNVEGDRELKNINVTIPSSPAVGVKDPAISGFPDSYTIAYLPK